MLSILLNEIKITLKTMTGHLFLPLLVFILLFILFSTAAKLSDVSRLMNNGINIGVVKEDENEYIDMLISGVNEMGILNNLINIEEMSLPEARSQILENEIAAYIIVPEGYVEEILRGEMPPLTFVCNLKKPLETSAIMIAAKSSIAILNTSQAGVFATIDFALENGLSAGNFYQKIIIPVNLKFISILINFESFYRFINLSSTGGLDVNDFYARSLSCLFMFLFLVYFYRHYKTFFKKPLLSTYRVNKISISIIVLSKYLSAIITLAAAFLPMLFIFRTLYPALIFCFSGILIFASAFFTDKPNGILFIIIYGLFDLCAGGGAMPIPLLPNSLSFIRLASVNYYAVFYEQGAPVLIIIGLLFTLIAGAKLRFVRG